MVVCGGKGWMELFGEREKVWRRGSSVIRVFVG